MKKPFILKIKNLKGRRCIFPDCDTSRLFADMLNSISVRKDHIPYIEALGFDVVITEEGA